MRRTEEEMVTDVVNLLNALNKGTILTERAKFKVLDDISWEWTEWRGKYVGCQYWSKEALALYDLHKTEKGVNYGKAFTHEHIVPKKIIINYLLSLEGTSEANFNFVNNLLHRILHAAIVTKDENNKLNKYRDKMPDEVSSSFEDYTNRDLWLRYIKTKISVYHIVWEKRQLISKFDYSINKKYWSNTLTEKRHSSNSCGIPFFHYYFITVSRTSWDNFNDFSNSGIAFFAGSQRCCRLRCGTRSGTNSNRSQTDTKLSA